MSCTPHGHQVNDGDEPQVQGEEAPGRHLGGAETVPDLPQPLPPGDEGGVKFRHGASFRRRMDGRVIL